MEEFNELKNYIKYSSQNIDNFEWNLSFNGNYWNLEIDGESIDGSEEHLEYNNYQCLIEMLEKVKEDI